ncbi:uncharacterized protein BDR25DRAFT_349331 [Lindgomyces ingoldianus]|uniref:Uncharacterized protein n=1 Tax=Lindgomyces ingoldianus TaxID=673940 RepID=A0ACB6RAX7_9PLEO|nr:uncharacterized protein BDR25DRAFT_349331 [Lindgomyces ingoldianus]KAF2476205.1 hypothetical protein BDR25DRAFT_349331 [Lindgomyces ingoldianus]
MQHKDAKGRPQKLQIREEVEVLTKQQTQATSKAKTSNKQETGAYGFLGMNSLSFSQDAAGSAKIFTVPRPRARFAAKGQSQNLRIVLANIRNYTTTASRVLGHGELEDINFWNGAAAARSSQIQTRVVARKGEDKE